MFLFFLVTPFPEVGCSALYEVNTIKKINEKLKKKIVSSIQYFQEGSFGQIFVPFLLLNKPYFYIKKINCKTCKYVHVYMFIYLFITNENNLHICSCLHVYLSIPKSTQLFIYFSIFIYPSVYLFIHLYIPLDKNICNNIKNNQYSKHYRKGGMYIRDLE